MRRDCPVARSAIHSSHRSDSYPARDCERQAIHLPSGEYCGLVSAPFRVVMRRASDAGFVSEMTKRSEFVDVAGSGLVLRAKTSSSPCGAMSNSSPPPREKGGAANAPGVRSRGAPASGTSTMCERVGSCHAFQCRYIRLVMIRAFVGFFSSAEVLSLMQAGSTPQSG